MANIIKIILIYNKKIKKMARRVLYKNNGLMESNNPLPDYKFVGYDGLTYSQLDSEGNITPITYQPVYKVYTALLTQSGEDDPVATVLENTLGNIVWSRQNIGQYIGTLAGAFVVNKVVCPQFPALAFEGKGTFTPISNNGNPQLGWINMYCQTPNEVEIDTYNMTGGEEWSIVFGSSLFIEIRVYN